MKGFVRESKGDWEYYHLPEMTAAGVVHGFFTRKSPPSELQGAEGKVFLDMFSLDASVMLDQDHGTEIHHIANGERRAHGDGLLLSKPGVAGIIKTADCLCVVLADPALPMVSIVHAGWRGTVKGIVSKALDMMIQEGAARQNIMGLMGPSIRGCCYEVGQEVHDQFLTAGFPEDVFSFRSGSVYLDLKDANTWLLNREGVEVIYDTGRCTYCTGDEFVSYRRGARNERQINFVAIGKGHVPGIQADDLCDSQYR